MLKSLGTKLHVGLIGLLLIANMFFATSALGMSTEAEQEALDQAEEAREDALIFNGRYSNLIDICKGAIEVESVENKQLLFNDSIFNSLSENSECSNKQNCATEIIYSDLDNLSNAASFESKVSQPNFDSISSGWTDYYLKNESFDQDCNLQIDGDEKKQLANVKTENCLNIVKKDLSGSEGQHYKTYYDNYLKSGVEAYVEELREMVKTCVAEEVGTDGFSNDVEFVLDKPFISEYYNVNDLVADGQTNNLTGDGPGGPVVAFIVKVINLLIQLVGIASLLMIVVGAYFLLTAAGNEEQIGKGKDTIIYALVGMGIVIFSFLIISFVQAIIY